MTKTHSLGLSRPLSWATLPLFLASAAATGLGCGAGDDPVLDDVQQHSAAISNGYALSSNGTAAAVYRWVAETSSWSLPCSGTVLKRVPGRSVVLTARACVTSNGAINGPLLPPSRIRISTLLAPGTSPPASAVTPVSVHGLPNATNTADQNVAALATTVELPAPGPGAYGTTPIYRGTNAGVVGRSFYTVGYGSGGPAGAAGVLRGASDFPIINGSGSPPLTTGTLAFTNSGEGADGAVAQVLSGDRGSPHVYSMWINGTSTTVNLLVGITSVVGSPSAYAASVSGIAEWLQNSWGIYLSSVAAGSYNVGANGAGPADGGWLYGRHVGDSINTRSVQYIAASKQLRFSANGTFCLQPESGYVRLRTCNGSAIQRWDLTDDLTLRHVSSGQCIREAGEWPTMSACDGSITTKWYWHLQP